MLYLEMLPRIFIFFKDVPLPRTERSTCLQAPANHYPNSAYYNYVW